MKTWMLITIVVAIVGACSLAPKTVSFPTVQRADTRDFIAVRFADSIQAHYMLGHIVNQLPNESSLCFLGHAKDTTFVVPIKRGSAIDTTIVRNIAVIDSVYEANIDEAGNYFVTYIDGTACKPESALIGIIHSHPLSPITEQCNHSDNDALFGHGKKDKYWFSITICEYGIQILWADGRRWNRRTLWY